MLNETSTQAEFGVRNDTVLLKIIQLENGKPKKDKTTGLYHVAYLVPTRADLGLLLNHFIELNIPLQGMSNHGISEAIYLTDPDWNGIEIAVDSPDSTWQWINGKLDLLANNGPMDVESVLNESKNLVFNGFSAKTIIGHLHLHVSELIESKKF